MGKEFFFMDCKCGAIRTRRLVPLLYQTVFLTEIKLEGCLSRISFISFPSCLYVFYIVNLPYPAPKFPFDSWSLIQAPCSFYMSDMDLENRDCLEQ